MGKRESASAALGFLTIVRHPQQGLCGGYLVLNQSGRPLEFHCTAPVRPNRAQEILYGPTLEPYLCGEQIGYALVSRAGADVSLVLTDVPAVLALRAFVEQPVALVLGEASLDDLDESPASSTRGKQYRVDSAQSLQSPHALGLKLHEFPLHGRRLAVEGPGRNDRGKIEELVTELQEGFDLAEPFERIREAIEEARRATL